MIACPGILAGKNGIAEERRIGIDTALCFVLPCEQSRKQLLKLRARLAELLCRTEGLCCLVAVLPSRST